MMFKIVKVIVSILRRLKPAATNFIYRSPSGDKLFLPRFYAMPHALGVLLNADGKFDEEGGASGFVVPDPDISIVIRDDRVDDGQP